jgi:glutamate dehydrogenase
MLSMNEMDVQKQTVLQLVADEGVFSFSAVRESVEYFYNFLGLHPKYFAHFNAQEVARHIHLLLAATKMAQAIKSKAIKFHIETEDSAFYLSTLDAETIHVTEKLVANYIDRKLMDKEAFSVVYMRSENMAFIGADERLGIFIVSRSEFDAAKSIAPHELTEIDDINVIGSRHFLEAKSVDSLQNYQRLITRVMDTRGTVFQVEKSSLPEEEGYVVSFAVYENSTRSYVQEINQVFRFANIEPRRLYIESFANGLVTYTAYFPDATEMEFNSLYEAIKFVPHFKQTPGRSQLVWEMAMRGHISPAHCIYILAVVKFTYTFYPKEGKEYLDLIDVLGSDQDAQQKLEEIFKQAVSERLTSEKLYETFTTHLDITRVAFEDFEAIAKGKKSPFWNVELENKISAIAENSLERKILNSLLIFNENLLMTNFYKAESAPASIAFRFKSDILKNRPKVLFPEMPFGVYMVMGRGFYGFHVRFRDVARGGIRLIRSRDKPQYERNSQSLFEETYNLAYTQQAKNKDIPEGGAKGTILLDAEFSKATGTVALQAGRDSFFKFIDALLDCMLPDDAGIYSHMHPHEEILFFGPDEGTAEFMDMGATRGRERGYPYWKALTTGKSAAFGGVPHDVYGMTTMGVHVYVVELLKAVGVAENSVTKFSTGGPDGDLGSNEILISRDKTIGMVDGSGVAYDPNGLDRKELSRLAKKRIPISNFDKQFLGPEGFIYTIEDTNIVLPDGTAFRTGTELRDKFHTTDYAAADLFVPCGGRPASVNKTNVMKLFKDNKPKFKYIVEGANLFFTDDARRVLENAGVHLFKDASANKGGVTSSSMEVLAALAMEPEEHDELLTIPEGSTDPPQFYKDYVRVIGAVIRRNARLEFKAIWTANQKQKINKVELTKIVSQKINSLADYISEVLDMTSPLARKILKRALPNILINQCTFERIIARVPQNYLRAVAATWVASRYIYKYGIEASEFSFYQFMRQVELSDECAPNSTDEELSSPRARAPKEVAKCVTDTSYKQAPFKLRIPSMDDMAASSASPRSFTPSGRSPILTAASLLPTISPDQL